MIPLTEKLESLHSASQDTVALLKDLFTKTEFKKGWILGTFRYMPFLYYIETGLVRGTAAHNGRVYTLWMQESGFIIPAGSFFTGKDNGEVIEFLRDTRGYALNLLRADALARNHDGLYKMLLEICGENLLAGRRREVLLQIRNAGERYRYFLDHFSGLERMLTDVQAADFLRIEKKYYYRIKKRAGQHFEER